MSLISNKEIDGKGYYYDLYSNRDDFGLGCIRDDIAIGHTFISDKKLFVVVDVDILNGRLIIEECSRGTLEKFF